jgi:hypothetical protein
MHVIDSLELDVSLASQAQAFAAQGALQDFLRGRALEVIDDVFNECSRAGQVLRLDRLEVDLGAVAAEEVPAVWERRLRQSLREQLRDQWQAQRWRSRSSRQAGLDTLTHFLRHGHLPWNGVQAARDGLAAWSEAVALREAAALLRWVRRSSDRDAVLTRLSQQLSLNALQALAAAWAGGDWPLAVWVDHAVARVAIETQPAQTLRRSLWRAALAALSRHGVPTPAALQALLWATAQAGTSTPGHAPGYGLVPERSALRGIEQALADASGPRLDEAFAQALARDCEALVGWLVHHGQAAGLRRRVVAALRPHTLGRLVAALMPAEVDWALFSGPVFMRAWQLATALPRAGARRLAQSAALDWALLQARPTDGANALLQGLLHGLLHTAADATARDPLALAWALQQGLAAQQPTHAGPPALREHLTAWREQAALAQARERADAALADGLAPSAHDDWPLLLAQDPAWLRAALRRHGRADATRTRLAQHLDHAQVVDSIVLLVPGEAGFVAGLLDEAALFAATPPALPPQRLAPALRQFTLAYLLADPGSQFNRRSLLAHLVQRMALRQGVPVHTLVCAMQAALAALGAEHGLRGQMLHLLADLAPPEAAPADAPPHEAAALATPGERLHLQLTRLLPDSALPVGSVWAPIEAALAAADDRALADALAQLCRTAPGRLALVQGLPDWLLHGLVARVAPGQAGGLQRFFSPALWPLWAGGTQTPGGLRARQAAWALWWALWMSRGRQHQDMSTFVRAWSRSALRRGVPAAVVESALVALGYHQPGSVPVQSGLSIGAWAPEAARVAATKHGERPGQGTGTPWPVSPDAAPGDALQARLAAALAGGAAQRLALLHWLADEGAQHRPHLQARQDQIDGLITCLRPDLLPPLQALAGHLARAAGLAPGMVAWAALQRAVGRFALDCLFVQGRRFDVSSFVALFADWLAMQAPAVRALAPPRPVWARAVQAQARADDRLAAAVAQGLRAAARPPAEARPRPPTPARKPAGTPLPAGAPVYVANAGLVLLAAYLPRLFTRLQLASTSALASPEAAQRAVHLTQWLVDGRSDAPEHELPLNKLLCGLALKTPAVRAAEPTAHEQATALQMLHAVIAHWKALGQTSVQGLRSTFLQREGRLVLDGDCWRLLVEPRAFDMLLDRLPWGFATVRLPWMERVIHVDWR